ncbi:methionine--tRNA ligase [Flavobacteriaceae bacterium 14752]|uniref:methionine--tRNA ligase n=1 Tax=Mesohalobacter salilacus TaxID=2491711 RepID=UPI000F62E632|nr:methionine--tRNA ligase [Flavobacteriaceae bacterium 14752]
MKDFKRYTITAALPYTNGPIHIGHLAGVYIPADIYARYLRLKNKDVLFVCGSDEHGVPITIKAKKEGVSPQDIVDRYHNMIKTSFEKFGIAFDYYGRTTSETHQKTASDFFKTLYDNDKFIEQTTEQLYDQEAQQFLADRFVTGTCPKCGHDEAYGDQCEKCGTSLNATDLINPKSAITGNKPTLKTTKHWFLPLDQYDDFLKEWIIKEHKYDWKPNVYGQCKSWIDEGLRPRAVTRDLDWGISVPLKDAEGKVLYVWFDAPIGYISATKEWAEQVGKNWKDYWKSDDTKLLHFIGKDNIVFHCIIFPCMLKAEGSFNLPDNVPANEFLNLEGQKLSTSKNWAVWLHEYLEDFPNQQDVLRYVLTANAPETKDNDFTWADFQARNNNELVAIYGNFINRVAVLTHKYYGGKVPQADDLQDIDQKTLQELKSFPEKIGQSIEKYRFREAQQKLMELARLGNKYLADEEPWKQFKTNPERTQNIMFVALQISTALAVLSEPFLPHTSKTLSDILRLKTLVVKLNWSNIAKHDVLLPTDHYIEKAGLLFSKIEDEQIQKQLNKLKQSKIDNESSSQDLTPQKEQITFDDFSKLDIRTGKIIKAEKMPKTKKLMTLKVDIGLEQRTIVSGIAEYFKAEEIIGKQVSVVINLKPIKLRGTLSEGMILMTENEKGKLVFVNSDVETPTGKTIA